MKKPLLVLLMIVVLVGVAYLLVRAGANVAALISVGTCAAIAITADAGKGSLVRRRGRHDCPDRDE
ncbi:hypothetical protein OSC27_12700 [Microbacterium sp. STN6]|uniref:hypothetical protein n=1 Tax=Microbacterium sp. STN6 TaxID=2995588 RepID=UPI002260EBF4|nr:hypothetical protein [Microbacterium sp. STN6]MCX7523131.1 hypothetical protein [Microbacterium sp. STN6]